MEWAWLSTRRVTTVRYSSDPGVKSHVDLLGPDGKRAVLRMERYRGTGKTAGRGTSSRTLRARRLSLGVPPEMLEQGSRETPVDLSSLRRLLKIQFPPKIHIHP